MQKIRYRARRSIHRYVYDAITPHFDGGREERTVIFRVVFDFFQEGSPQNSQGGVYIFGGLLSLYLTPPSSSKRTHKPKNGRISKRDAQHLSRCTYSINVKLVAYGQKRCLMKIIHSFGRTQTYMILQTAYTNRTPPLFLRTLMSRRGVDCPNAATTFEYLAT